jgi:hypothetical protein
MASATVPDVVIAALGRARESPLGERSTIQDRSPTGFGVSSASARELGGALGMPMA